MVNKGGCLKGRVGEKPNGGCKIGKRTQRKEPSKARGKPKTKAVKKAPARKAPARKAPVAKNKGGCLTGRVGERPNGGCKVGKKGPQRREPSKARAVKAPKAPKAKTAFQLENERVRLLNQTENAKPKRNIVFKKKASEAPKRKIVFKKKATEAPKRKIVFKKKATEAPKRNIVFKKKASKTLNTVADMERALAEIKKKERRAKALAKTKSVRQKIGY
tara:strand:- start:6848 stop:7501 length:654 start_codon:yes stop_codon:yes gene_type:complete